MIKGICRFLIIIVFICGCTTVGSLPQTDRDFSFKESDQENYTNCRVYLYSYSQVFRAARYVLQTWNFSIEKENMEDRVILASGQTQAFSSGAVIGLYFEKLGKDKISVKTIEKRKLSTQIAIKWHSSIVLDGIEKQLSLENTTKE